MPCLINSGKQLITSVRSSLIDFPKSLQSAFTNARIRCRSNSRSSRAASISSGLSAKKGITGTLYSKASKNVVVSFSSIGGNNDGRIALNIPVVLKVKNLIDPPCAKYYIITNSLYTNIKTQNLNYISNTNKSS